MAENDIVEILEKFERLDDTEQNYICHSEDYYDIAKAIMDLFNQQISEEQAGEDL